MKIVPMKLVTQARWLKRFINLWPPFVGAGISVTHLSDDFRSAEVKMKLSWYNRNYMGTQYGGSLYSMTDAFYAIMILRNLNDECYVWDKSASIEYIAPARSAVFASYTLTDEMLASIKQHIHGGEKYFYEVPVDITDTKNTLIARVHKVLYIRKKPEFR